ncbi:uncharacterized protein LOC107507871 isoform X1 [Rousettus aegyptiacus]|uniref:uncharacterized protein LOC107507871 isoform X1 n=1 Tax=Rousettus aegyptiacus TaxID=9407 RepID=UPI00168CF3BE|nr:uncharacterized protein LOC107507871 isoform X1 [Rousettus aegyptiacus]
MGARTGGSRRARAVLPDHPGFARAHVWETTRNSGVLEAGPKFREDTALPAVTPAKQLARARIQRCRRASASGPGRRDTGAACQEGTVRPAVPVALLSHRGRWYHSCGPGTRDGAREPGRTGRVPARSSVGSGREGPPRQSDRLTPCDGGSRRGTWLSGRHKSEVPGTPGPAVPTARVPSLDQMPVPGGAATTHLPQPCTAVPTRGRPCPPCPPIHTPSSIQEASVQAGCRAGRVSSLASRC